MVAPCITHCHQSPRAPSVKGAVCGLEEDWSIDMVKISAGFSSTFKLVPENCVSYKLQPAEKPHALHLHHT